MTLVWPVAVLMLWQANLRPDIRPVEPPSGPKPIGPYTPGISVGEYLYVSGQGARNPHGTMPSAFDKQVRQTLENVRAIVEANGLTMEHIVYTHVYLEDVETFGAMNRIYAQYFPKTPPARATLAVARLPGTPVEINAVAVRDLRNKAVVSIPGHNPREPLSAGILTHDRLFVSAMRGQELSSGKIPEDPQAQVNLALDGMEAVMNAAGLTLSHLAFMNPYLTKKVPIEVMNESYAKRFTFGNTPGRATIVVSGLPEGAQIKYTGVAVRDLRQRRAVRPRKMAPSPTASPSFSPGILFTVPPRVASFRARTAGFMRRP